MDLLIETASPETDLTSVDKKSVTSPTVLTISQTLFDFFSLVKRFL